MDRAFDCAGQCLCDHSAARSGNITTGSPDHFRISAQIAGRKRIICAARMRRDIQQYPVQSGLTRMRVQQSADQTPRALLRGQPGNAGALDHVQHFFDMAPADQPPFWPQG